MYKYLDYGYTKAGGKFMNVLQKIALLLTIVGALNWGLIGLFNYKLVEALFGTDSFFSMLIYILVGIAGVINIMLLFQDLDKN